MHLVGDHNLQSSFDRFSTFGMSRPLLAQIEVIAEAVLARAVKYEDILEEIVGEFTSSLPSSKEEIKKSFDGSFLVEGGAQIRTINRELGWALPNDGPKTLNGLITEHLENIPEASVCLRIDEYRIEILSIKDNVIRRAKLFRHIKSPKIANST